MLWLTPPAWPAAEVQRWGVAGPPRQEGGVGPGAASAPGQPARERASVQGPSPPGKDRGRARGEVAAGVGRVLVMALGPPGMDLTEEPGRLALLVGRSLPFVGDTPGPKSARELARPHAALPAQSGASDHRLGWAVVRALHRG